MFENENLQQQTNVAENTAENHSDEPKHVVKYNGEEIEMTLDELIVNAQKGMNYDKVKGKLDDAERKYGELDTKYRKYTSAMTSLGFDGDDDDNINRMISAASGASPEEVERERRRIEKLVANDPRVLRAKEFEERQRVETQMAADLIAIRTAFPEEKAKTIDDLPNADQYLARIKKGYDPVDAYRLANPTTHVVKRKTGDDKDHLTAAGGGRKGGDVDIPQDIYAEYRRFFPNMSREEIQKAHNRYNRKGD